MPSKREQRGRRKARRAGLVYVNDFDEGITRHPHGRGFTYRYASGRTVRAKRTRERIESLVIPPAWTDVWICRAAEGHIQARGQDDAGRYQYIYHDRWKAVSAATKYDRLHLIAELLPRVRRRVRKDLNAPGRSHERVVAAVVRMIDKAHLRVGNVDSAKNGNARGATTLTPDHVDVDGTLVSLEFPGKSGQRREVELRDAKVARVIERCEAIDGQYLFCYRAEDGSDRRVDSTDVNDYLREASGAELTAKDFRTWWGSVITLDALDRELPAKKIERKRHAVAAVDTAADALGNTRAVCRGSYVHPQILAAAESGELTELRARAARREAETAELTQAEQHLAALLADLSFA